MESFCVLVLAKGSVFFLQFPACTVSIQSFANVILNNLEGRKGQPVYRERACVLMFIRWHQHHRVDSVGTCITSGCFKENIRPQE